MYNLIIILTDPTHQLFKFGKNYTQPGNHQAVWKARGVFLMTMPIGVAETIVRTVWTVLKTTSYFLSFKTCSRNHSATQEQLFKLVRRISYVFAFGVLHAEMLQPFYEKSIRQFQTQINGTEVDINKEMIRLTMRPYLEIMECKGYQIDPKWYDAFRIRFTFLKMSVTGAVSVFYHAFCVIASALNAGKLDITLHNPTMNAVEQALVAPEKEHMVAQYRLAIAMQCAFQGLFGIVFNHQLGPKTVV